MMTFMPVGGTLRTICIFVECRAQGTLPARRLLAVYVGPRLWCDLIHFVYIAFPRDSVVDSRLGPKLPQAEEWLKPKI